MRPAGLIEKRPENFRSSIEPSWFTSEVLAGLLTALHRGRVARTNPPVNEVELSTVKMFQLAV